MDARRERLFTANVECWLDESGGPPAVVNCKSFVRTRLQQRSAFFFHPLCAGLTQHQPTPPAYAPTQQPQPWPERTHLVCWHDTEPFDTMPVPCVRSYDKLRDVYYVFGVFCSMSCAKAWMLEHEPALATLRLMYFAQMCREVFGVYDPVPPAPPQIRLQKFGGDLNLLEFRLNVKNVRTCVLAPPFIQTTVVLEEVCNQPPVQADNVLAQTHEQEAPFDVWLREAPEEPVEVKQQPICKKPVEPKVQRAPKPPRPAKRGKRLEEQPTGDSPGCDATPDKVDARPKPTKSETPRGQDDKAIQVSRARDKKPKTESKMGPEPPKRKRRAEVTVQPLDEFVSWGS